MLVSEWPKFQQRMADSISNGSENDEVADQIMLSLNYKKLESSTCNSWASAACCWDTILKPGLIAVSLIQWAQL